jgi:polar amino acid transport system substrate-binding protein
MRLHHILLSIYFIAAFNTPTHALTLGVESTDYSPYFYLNDEKKYQGATRDIIDLFSEVSQLKISYDPMSVPRLFNEFVKGNIDLKFPDSPLWSASLQADIKVFYSVSVFQVNESLLILKQENTEIKKEDIKQVGTILGFSTPSIAKLVANKEFETISTKSVEQLMHMLVSNRVQAVYFNEIVALGLVKKMYPKKQLSTHSQYPPFQYAYHLSSIKHPELITQFNQFLNSHADQVAKIRQRYGLK